MPSVTKVSRPWIRKAETQSEKKTDPFYLSKLWRGTREVHLAHNPLCFYCELSGRKHIPRISYVDHYRPRRLFPELELDGNNLRTSCQETHDIKRQWEKGIGSREQFERLIPELIAKFSKKQ